MNTFTEWYLILVYPPSPSQPGGGTLYFKTHRKKLNQAITSKSVQFIIASWFDL